MSSINPYEPPQTPPEPLKHRSLLPAIPALIVVVALYALILLRALS